MTNQRRKKQLIQLLIDDSALDADRDDAAMDLGVEFEDDEVLNALSQIAENKQEDKMILNSCGESIGQIWIRKNFFDKDFYLKLSGTARYGINIVVKSRKPEWNKKNHLDEDDFKDHK